MVSLFSHEWLQVEFFFSDEKQNVFSYRRTVVLAFNLVWTQRVLDDRGPSAASDEVQDKLDFNFSLK